MCRMVFRTLLIFAFCCYGEVRAGHRTGQGSQRGFLLPGGQYEEFYCNCWTYTPRCTNVCKNYITRYGAMGSSTRPAQVKAPVFNPNTTHYQGPGAVLGGYAAGTARQADVYPGHLPVQHLSIETIISSERLGKRTPSAQGPRKAARKPPQLAGEAGPAQIRSLPPVLPAFPGKNGRSTNVESDRRMCELLVWIHQAGANSTDRRQRALLRSILSHFFRSNNLTEIVCKAGGSPASKRDDAYETLYTITKGPYVNALSPRTGVHAVPSSVIDVQAGSGPSRVLYSKIYYTTTITPITTILTSLDEFSTETSACEPSVSKQTSLISTMSKADIKQDALIVAGKVQERRSKIENILSSAHKAGDCVDGEGSRADARSRYRTTFVWKTVTPYITKEVLQYPKTAYYTTTELFTITPLTTIFVDYENVGAGRENGGVYTVPGFANDYGAASDGAGRENGGVYTAPGFALADDINDLREKKPLAIQARIPGVVKGHGRITDVTSQKTPTENNTSERRVRDSTDAVRKPGNHKGGEGTESSVIVHSGSVSEHVPDKELQIQRSRITEKDVTLPSSVDMKSVLESASLKNAQPLHSDFSSALSTGTVSASLKNAQPLHSDSSSALSTSKTEFIQNESAYSSLLKTQYWMQSASSGAGLTTDREGSHSFTAGMTTTTVLITTTVILDLERILEGQVRDIVRRKNVMYKEKEQNVDDSHEGTAHASKSDEDISKGSIERKKGEDKENSKQQDTKIAEHTRHSDDEEDTRTDTDHPTTKSLDHTEANKNVGADASLPQISDASFSAEKVAPTVDVAHRNSTGVDAVAESRTQRSSTRKKTVTKVFTILTEGESHSSGVTGLGTPYTVTKYRNADIAYGQASRSMPHIEKEPSFQTREHMFHRTHLMDIPLVSAIVHEISAANISRTVSVTTTTKTECAEDGLSGVLEKPRALGLKTKTQEQLLRSGSSTTIPNTQAVQSVTGKDGKSALPTIREMVSSSTVFIKSASKETLPDKSSSIDAVQKGGTRTGLDSNSPAILRREVDVNDSTGRSPSPVTHYSKEDAGSKTASTFPIVKKVDIDENLGVEIRVEPV